MHRSLHFFALALMTAAPPALAAPNVVASIKPIHSLVASVMQGVGEPTLLVRGNASPHTYAMRPSDAAALESADLVFWTGHGLELFLADTLDTLSPDAISVELVEADGMTLLPLRQGGTFDVHQHDEDEHHDHDDHGNDDHHDHAEDGVDMHVWLDPENAKVMLSAIAGELSTLDPENADLYAANAQSTSSGIDALAAELTTELAPYADRPIVVFHDAYQYFEQAFGITVAASITVSPDIMPGAQRIGEIKARIAEIDAGCVFAEPQFEPTILAAVTEGTDTGTGTIDPEGAQLEPGPDLYAQLLRGISAGLAECLGS